MAVASIIIYVEKCHQDSVERNLSNFSAVSEIQILPQNSIIPGFALVLEAPSDKLTEELKSIEALPFVQELQFVFADYGEDLDGEGRMPAPPEKES